MAGYEITRELVRVSSYLVYLVNIALIFVPHVSGLQFNFTSVRDIIDYLRPTFIRGSSRG